MITVEPSDACARLTNPIADMASREYEQRDVRGKFAIVATG